MAWLLIALSPRPWGWTGPHLQWGVMTVFLSRFGEVILLQVCGTAEGILGELTREITPGQNAFGKTYEEWAKMPSGGHEIDSAASPMSGRGR